MSRADGCDADALAGHLAHAMRHANSSLFRPLWELREGPRDLLSYRVVQPSGPLPMVPVRDASSDSVERSEEALAAFPGIRLTKRLKLDKSWEEQLDKDMLAAVKKWHSIILGAPGEFELGRRCSRDDPLGMDLMKSLKHVFSGRAAGTLHNRANPLLRFLHWCSCGGLQAYPIDEGIVYAFCSDVEGTSSPSFLKSFLSSLVFAHHVLGLSGALEAADSQRVQGVARATFLTKRKRQSKPPLTQTMVRSLEILVCDPAKRSIDRYVAGFFLVCVYMRARYSDGLHMQDLSREVAGSSSLDGYLEAQVMRSKTSYTVESGRCRPCQWRRLFMGSLLSIGCLSGCSFGLILEFQSVLLSRSWLSVRHRVSGAVLHHPLGLQVRGYVAFFFLLVEMLLRCDTTGRTPARLPVCHGQVSVGLSFIIKERWVITLPLGTAWSTFTLGMPLRQRFESWTRCWAWYAMVSLTQTLVGPECLLGVVLNRVVLWLRL